MLSSSATSPNFGPKPGVRWQSPLRSEATDYCRFRNSSSLPWGWLPCRGLQEIAMAHMAEAGFWAWLQARRAVQGRVQRAA